jgi:hypothetical protein
MSFVGDIIEAVFDFAGDVIEFVGDVVFDVVDFVVDGIIEPVFKAVGNVIEAALDDPIKTIAQVAAFAMGAPAWVYPLIEGADVAIAGGDLDDVLKSVAVSYVAQNVGSYVGKTVSSAVSNAASGYGVNVGSQQAAMLAAQDAATRTAESIAGRVVGSAAAASAVAVVTGRDPVQAFLTGGINAAVPAVLGQISGFRQLPNTAQHAIADAVRVQLSGGNVTDALISSVLRTSGLVTDILNTFDPAVDANGNAIPPEERKMTDAQRAIAADVLMGSATAALTGKDVPAAMRNALFQNGVKALGDMITDGFKSAVGSVATAYGAAEKQVEKLTANIEQQKGVAANYNAVVNELNGRVAEQDRLKAAYDAAVAAQRANPNQATTDAANAAARAYNDYATTLNADYEKTFKPQIDKYAAELAKIQDDYGNLEQVYTDMLKDFENATAQTKDALKPVLDTSAKAFVEVLDPNFNPDEYRKINNLGADVDVYEHWLSDGQFKGLHTNNKDAAVREAINRYTETMGQEPPKHVVEAMARPENQERDKHVQQYVDASIRDKQQEVAFRTQVANTILDAYEAEGLTPEQIRAKVDSGEATQYVDGAIARKRENITQMQEYTRAVGERFGTDSEEYREAYRNTLNAMSEVGGYGVTKQGDNFEVAGAGTIDPDDLNQATQQLAGRWWVDPVTNELHVDIFWKSTGDRDVSSLWAIGESANPPTQGGESVFGNGSGVSSGLFGGLQPVAIDDGRGDAGAKMYAGGTGFALIAYSDGTGAAIDPRTNEVIWVSPDQMESLLKEIPPAKESLPSAGNSNIAAPAAPSITNPVQDTVTAIKDKIQSPQDVKQAFEQAGYKATDEEIAQFVGEKPKEVFQQEFEAYIDPRMVDEQEVRAAYEALGLKKPTQADVEKLIGQYAETDLAGRATENLDSARYNSIMYELENMAVQAGISPEALEAIKADFNDQFKALGVDVDRISGQVGQVQQQIDAVSQDLQTKYDALTDGQKALANQLTQQGVDLNTAIDFASQQAAEALAGTEQRLGTQIGDLQTTLGRPGAQATQADLDTIIGILSSQGAYDANYDFDGDGAITQKDADAISGVLGGGAGVGVGAAGSKWAPTGLFAQQAEEAERTRQAQAAEAARIRQAQAQQAQRTQRMGNINSMMGMLTQAPDIGGQQVTVKAPDPAKIGYIYDWSSIFANPAQEKMFVTPFSQPQPAQQRPMGFGFAQGGAVRGELDDVNDELLKMLKG